MQCCCVFWFCGANLRDWQNLNREIKGCKFTVSPFQTQVDATWVNDILQVCMIFFSGGGSSCCVFWFWEAVRQGVWWIRRPRLHWWGDVTPTYETGKIWIGKYANLQFLHLKHKMMQLELHDINQLFVNFFSGGGFVRSQRSLIPPWIRHCSGKGGKVGMSWRAKHQCLQQWCRVGF